MLETIRGRLGYGMHGDSSFGVRDSVQVLNRRQGRGHPFVSPDPLPGYRLDDSNCVCRVLDTARVWSQLADRDHSLTSHADQAEFQVDRPMVCLD